MATDEKNWDEALARYRERRRVVEHAYSTYADLCAAVERLLTTLRGLVDEGWRLRIVAPERRDP